MRIVLDVIRGPLEGRSFDFEGRDPVVVGRSKLVQCSIPEDSALSRDHFMIELRPPLCELRDLGSTNGTFVNEQRVDWVQLNSGDRIAAGQSTFLVRVVRDQAPATEEPPVSRGRAAPTMVATAPRPGSGALAVAPPIVCAGCGMTAPPHVDVVHGSRFDADDPIEWLCELCRAEATTTPQPVPYYTTIRQLGRGGMGVVFLARHNQTGRLVALKLLVPETAATQSAVERFLREMSVVSQLKHPNIVEWLEQGMTRGQFWFAMEYVSGTNLEALAHEEPGRYPINQACRMACQILKGLEHAHGLGFVHRDIKPENILIGRTPQGMVAKISDFGLAKSYRGVGLSGLTFSGEMRGTIPFMPPEQMLDFRTVLPAGDLFSTAATLYYLITGKYVYEQGEAGGDLIRLLLEDRTVPIQERRPEVPRGLGAVLEKCLARDPNDRYPNAQSMRLAIRPFC